MGPHHPSTTACWAMWLSIVNSHTFLVSYSGKQGWHVQEGTSKLLILYMKYAEKWYAAGNLGEAWKGKAKRKGADGNMKKKKQVTLMYDSFLALKTFTTQVCLPTVAATGETIIWVYFVMESKAVQPSAEGWKLWKRECVAANSEYKCLCLSVSLKHLVQ